MIGYSLRGMKYLLRSYQWCVQREPWSDFYAMLFGSISAGLHQCLQILLIIIKSVCIVSKNLHAFKNQSFVYSFEVVWKRLSQKDKSACTNPVISEPEMALFPIKTLAGLRCYYPFSFLLILLPLLPVSQKRVIAYPYLWQISGCALSPPPPPNPTLFQSKVI